MKEERAWRWLGMIALIINWVISMGLAGSLVEAPIKFGLPRPLLLILGLTPAILLTVARKWSLTNPWLMTRTALGAGLAMLVGWTMFRQIPKFSLNAQSLWPWVVPPVIYLILTGAVLMMAHAGLNSEPYEPAPNGGQRFTRRLKYLI